MLNLFFKIMIVYLAFSHVSYAATVRIGLEENTNPPYVMGQGADIVKEKPGINIELLQKVGENLNIEFKFLRRPWNRVLKEVELGQLDAALDSSFKKERAVYGVYPLVDGKDNPSKRIMDRSYLLYQRKGEPLLWDGKQFSATGKVFGVMRGYAVVSELQKEGLEIEEVSSQKQLINMLHQSRIDGVIGLESYIDYQLSLKKNLAIRTIKVMPPIRHKPYYVMFSKKFANKNMPLIEKIWNEMEGVRNSLFYSEMVGEYLKETIMEPVEQ